MRIWPEKSDFARATLAALRIIWAETSYDTKNPPWYVF